MSMALPGRVRNTRPNTTNPSKIDHLLPFCCMLKRHRVAVPSIKYVLFQLVFRPRMRKRDQSTSKQIVVIK